MYLDVLRVLRENIVKDTPSYRILYVRIEKKIIIIIKCLYWADRYSIVCKERNNVKDTLNHRILD